VHLQKRLIPASKYIFNERWRGYSDTEVTEVDRVTGSIYSADPGVDRHQLISLSSCHTMQIHTLHFPTFGLTRSVQDSVDPQCQVVSYFVTQFVCCSNYNCSFSIIPFRCCEGCGGVLMLGSLPSCSIVSPQWPPSGTSLSSLNGCVQMLLRLCSIPICGQIDHMYIYRKT